MANVDTHVVRRIQVMRSECADYESENYRPVQRPAGVSGKGPGPAGTGAGEQTAWWGLARRRSKWVLTWRGRLLVLALGAGVLMVGGRHLPFFLAVNAPVTSEVLVVEGWVPDYALAAAVAEFKERGCARLYATGGPREAGVPLSEYKTYATLSSAVLIRLGLSEQAVQAVSAPGMRKDRTYASAVALREWLRAHGGVPLRFNVLSVGPHARRTRLMYEKAFGKNIQVGIIAIEDQDYPAAQWWKSSSGVRSVLDEALAYVYARVFFRRPGDGTEGEVLSTDQGDRLTR